MSGSDGSNQGGEPGWPIPIIDAAKCTGCGLCVEACPNEALSMLNGCAVVSKPDACMYTGNCELICPEDAISRPYQLIFVDQTKE